MTVLQRTDLTTSQKIQCAAAAVAGQHAHGSKTALSADERVAPARGVGRALVGAGGELGVHLLVLGPGAAQASCARPVSCAVDRHLLRRAYGALQDQLGAASASLLEAVEAVLHQRHRASSAIEGFNAALRPYLYVRHKGARAASGSTQGFLDLFRAWFNLRTRRWGRHKGTSAHECLTGQRVHDWLTLLGCPPSPTLH